MKTLKLILLSLLMALAFTACQTVGVPPQPNNTQTGFCLPQGMFLEEHLLKPNQYSSEGRLFTPAEGSMDEVLSKHADLLSKKAVSNPGDKKVEISSPTALGDAQFLAVMEDGKTILTVDVGQASPISPYLGLWEYGTDWYLEAAYVNVREENNITAIEPTGMVYLNGVSLNEEHGFEETFGFQLLNGKPFFFYQENGKIGFSWDGTLYEKRWDSIPHYNCCSAGAFNPIPAEKMVSFFAEKGSESYYVELGFDG